MVFYIIELYRTQLFTPAGVLEKVETATPDVYGKQHAIDPSDVCLVRELLVRGFPIQFIAILPDNGRSNNGLGVHRPP